MSPRLRGVSPASKVDARGLLCPMPLVMAKLRMEQLEPGEELVVMATDPEAAIDLAAWAADEGHAFSQRHRANWSELVLRQRSPP